jgi:hypothetical protein
MNYHIHATSSERTIFWLFGFLLGAKNEARSNARHLAASNVDPAASPDHRSRRVRCFQAVGVTLGADEGANATPIRAKRGIIRPARLVTVHSECNAHVEMRP